MSDNKQKTGTFTRIIKHTIFVLSNGLEMVSGSKFNWEFKNISTCIDDKIDYCIPDKVLSISFIKDSSHYICNWYPSRKTLIITSNVAHSFDTTLSFACELELAETIVNSFIEANDLEIIPLYKKYNNV